MMTVTDAPTLMISFAIFTSFRKKPPASKT
ncbi:hypothetical protein HNR31_002897 [Anoxybacillus caldiproteolyticus]|uniref:Uncharacterized protein n=1 Tax=Thermaerobacillus caldiproteolyticus TaxID=247480 RepID=A0A7V9Z8P1_9BACL|nr:hypothetical protein [Anoxybacillus caldiproteolyticus]